MVKQLLSPIHKASRQVGVFLETRLAALPLSSPHGHLLTYLASYGPCAVGELHRVFGFKRSTLTSMLDRMEESGLLERVVDESDRRSIVF